MKCEKWLEKAVEGLDFVVCKICNYKAKNLKQHIERKHAIKADVYKCAHGSVAADKFTQRKRALNNWNWQEKFKHSGDPEKQARFEKWRSELGQNISKGILDSPSAREARRKNFSKLGKSEHMRQKASESAKKTSARPEVIAQRTENLRVWREKHPEKFQEITSHMIGTFQSKPEKLLFEVMCLTYPVLDFKRNQRLKRPGQFMTTKFNARQIDIISVKQKIVIEFDGIRHFKDVCKKTSLVESQRKDRELNDVLSAEGFTVIRVCYDQHTYKKGGYFLPACLSQIDEIIREEKRGVFLIGDAYKLM